MLRLLCILLLGVFITFTTAYEYYDVDPYEARNITCTQAGTFCDGCYSLVECIEIEDSFIQVPLGECPSGSTCQEATGTCTTEINVKCITGYIFTCFEPGIFPDPYNCSKYHHCIPDENGDVQTNSILRNCTAGFYFDSRTTLCRKKLVNNTCPYSLPKCTTAGEAGLIPDNPSLYYLCLRSTDSPDLYAQIFLCPTNEEYDLDSKRCVDTSPVTGLDSEGRCTSLGAFYNSTNCLYFNNCVTVGTVPTSTLCADKMHFNPKTRTCVNFTCNDID